MRFNPFAPAFRQDPYPQYAALRAQPPIRTLGMWVLTRHADVLAVLRDRTFSAELIPALVARHGGDTDRILRLGRASLVFTDNPAHARLRGLVNRAFTPAAVAELEPAVREIAGRRVADLRHDLMAEVAVPLPVEVLCTWLGLPAELHDMVAGWTHDVRFLLEPGMLRGDDLARVADVVDTFAGALTEVLHDRPAGLLTRLAEARTSGGHRLADEEIALLGIMCFVAGSETSTALIGNAALAVLHDPVTPEQVPAAVRETLRHESPLQMTKRIATRDLEIGGAAIAAGDQVLLCLAAANRDDAVFPDPDRFDVARPPGPHLGFGFGMHGCLGGALAELQAGAVLDALVRTPVELAGEVRWQTESLIVRSPVALPVRRVDGAATAPSRLPRESFSGAGVPMRSRPGVPEGAR
ncbi:cytochrome P450 [Pseudonocardia ailaonensis]|uniref:Cytochrome P450 n=1 Tax=Pseudonocardia ailaonensis TaxID=367279 RepID=A0ABN2N643_9PSEU